MANLFKKYTPEMFKVKKKKCYTNQKYITVLHQLNGDRYSIIRNADYNTMLDKLSGKDNSLARDLWLYMALNANGYSFGLSSKDFIKKFKCNRATYAKAVNILINNGYLIRCNDLNDIGIEHYLFVSDGGPALEANGWDKKDENNTKIGRAHV